VKFILCAAPEGASPRQKEISWTYICEGNPKVGDIVFANFGFEDEYLKVVQVATKRSKLDTQWDGALKSARPATGLELYYLEKIEKAWAAVNRAESRAMQLNELLTDAQCMAVA
jgi:hypothetical protein